MNGDSGRRLEVVVFGLPKPQGSKKAIPIYRGSKAKGNREFTGRAAVVEQNSELLTGWRDAVCAAAVKAISCKCGDPECTSVEPGFPWDFPIAGRFVFTMAKPAKPAYAWPAGNVGDLSKLTRSTEDALADAGVFVNDCRIVEYGRMAKVYPESDPESLGRPGARLILTAAGVPAALMAVEGNRAVAGRLF